MVRIVEGRRIVDNVLRTRSVGMESDGIELRSSSEHEGMIVFWDTYMTTSARSKKLLIPSKTSIIVGTSGRDEFIALIL